MRPSVQTLIAATCLLALGAESVATAPGAKSLHEAIYYLRGRGAQAIRFGDWKYRIATEKSPKEKKSKRKAASVTKPEKINVETLHNLSNDIGEQTNLIDEHPEIAQRLKRQLATFETDLRKNLRPAGVASGVSTGGD